MTNITPQIISILQTPYPVHNNDTVYVIKLDIKNNKYIMHNSIDICITEKPKGLYNIYIHNNSIYINNKKIKYIVYKSKSYLLASINYLYKNSILYLYDISVYNTTKYTGIVLYDIRLYIYRYSYNLYKYKGICSGILYINLGYYLSGNILRYIDSLIVNNKYYIVIFNRYYSIDTSELYNYTSTINNTIDRKEECTECNCICENVFDRLNKYRITKYKYIKYLLDNHILFYVLMEYYRLYMNKYQEIKERIRNINRYISKDQTLLEDLYTDKDKISRINRINKSILHKYTLSIFGIKVTRITDTSQYQRSINDPNKYLGQQWIEHSEYQYIEVNRKEDTKESKIYYLYELKPESGHNLELELFQMYMEYSLSSKNIEERRSVETQTKHTFLNMNEISNEILRQMNIKRYNDIALRIPSPKDRTKREYKPPVTDLTDQSEDEDYPYDNTQSTNHKKEQDKIEDNHMLYDPNLINYCTLENILQDIIQSEENTEPEYNKELSLTGIWTNSVYYLSLLGHSIIKGILFSIKSLHQDGDITVIYPSLRSNLSLISHYINIFLWKKTREIPDHYNDITCKQYFSDIYSRNSMFYKNVSSLYLKYAKIKYDSYIFKYSIGTEYVEEEKLFKLFIYYKPFLQATLGFWNISVLDLLKKNIDTFSALPLFRMPSKFVSLITICTNSMVYEYIMVDPSNLYTTDNPLSVYYNINRIKNSIHLKDRKLTTDTTIFNILFTCISKYHIAKIDTNIEYIDVISKIPLNIQIKIQLILLVLTVNIIHKQANILGEIRIRSLNTLYKQMNILKCLYIRDQLTKEIVDILKDCLIKAREQFRTMIIDISSILYSEISKNTPEETLYKPIALKKLLFCYFFSDYLLSIHKNNTYLFSTIRKHSNSISLRAIIIRWLKYPNDYPSISNTPNLFSAIFTEYLDKYHPSNRVPDSTRDSFMSREALRKILNRFVKIETQSKVENILNR
ncbi:hypothetical protein NEOKW01_0168 [Nematocida sp. AWRm80]|nr:hypothetical protein NEOKW01_0168 [Nematocida sp. AWRm80]